MIKSFYTGLLAQSKTDTGKQPNNRKKSPAPKLILRIVLSIGILGLLFWWLPTEKLLTAMQSIPLTTGLIVITGFIVGHVISALKWRMMLQATGTAINISRAIRAHGAGLFANLCLPSIVGGDFIRAALVIKEQQSKLEAIATGSLADRINDTLALVIIAGTASLFLPESEQFTAGQILSAIAILLLLGVIGAIITVRFIPTERAPDAIRNILGKVNHALDSLFSAPFTALTGLLLSLCIQCGFVGLNITLAQAMSINVPIVVWLFAWPMAKLIALAPVSLGGIGVREVALAGLLVPFGVEASLSVAQSLSWEVVLIVSGILAGTTVALLPSHSNTESKKETVRD